MFRFGLPIILALALTFALFSVNTSATPFTGTGPGSSTIGSGGDYASLKAACDAVNTVGSLTGGNWTFLITGNLTETDDCYLGVNTNGNTITFKPDTSVTATISYPTATTSGLGQHIVIGRVPGPTNIKSDNIVFDGSNTVGGTTRDLTITTSGTVRRLFGIHGDSDNVTLKNCIMTGTGIQVTGYTTLVPDNLLVDNCSIDITLTLDNNFSALTATNALFRDCTITNTSAQQRSFTLNSINDISFLRCTIDHRNISSNEVQGFWCGLTTPKTMNFDQCNITYRLAASTGDNAGGGFITSFVDDTINMTNNFITILGAAANADSGNGLCVVQVAEFATPSANVNFYHNSCILRTTADTGDDNFPPRFCIIRCKNGTKAYTGTTNFKNNVVLNMWKDKSIMVPRSLSGALIFDGSSGILNSDNNLIYVDKVTDASNQFGFFNGVGYADRASWTAGTTLDANSSDSVNPLNNWVSNTDFHFGTQPQGAPEWLGVPLGILTDYDGNSRSATLPTKGADEALPYNPASVNDYSIYR